VSYIFTGKVVKSSTLKLITFIGYLVQKLYKMGGIGCGIFMLKFITGILHELFDIEKVLLILEKQPTPQNYSDRGFNIFQILHQMKEISRLEWRTCP